MSDPTIYKQDDGTLRVDWTGARPQWVQVAPDVIDGWAETHNALLARAQRAEADADRLVKWGHHEPDCSYWSGVYDRPCSCGWSADKAAHDEAVAQR